MAKRNSIISYEYRPAPRRARALTLDRVMNSSPFPMPTLSAADLPSQFRRQHVPKHAARSSNVSVAARREAILPGTVVTQASGFQPRLTDRVADINVFPYTAVAKMVFQSNNSTFVGSAWIVGRRALVTAAHCLYDDEVGDFYDNITFVFGFDGTSEQSRSIALESAVHPNYTAKPFPENLRWDIGVAIVEEDLTTDFGALGYDASGTVAATEIEAIGFPAEARPIPKSRNGGQADGKTFGFDGASMWHSIGENLGKDGDLLGMENEMTGGCSGGPWVVSDNVAVGLNSHRLVPHDNRMFSPAFDDDLIELLQWLSDRDAL